jgi:hypothetical protein
MFELKAVSAEPVTAMQGHLFQVYGDGFNRKRYF